MEKKVLLNTFQPLTFPVLTLSQLQGGGWEESAGIRRVKIKGGGEGARESIKMSEEMLCEGGDGVADHIVPTRVARGRAGGQCWCSQGKDEEGGGEGARESVGTLEEMLCKGGNRVADHVVPVGLWT